MSFKLTLLLILTVPVTKGFRTSCFGHRRYRPLSVDGNGTGRCTKSTILEAKAAKKKKKKKNVNINDGGLRGFGPVGKTKDNQVRLDRSNKARLFYDYMEEGGAGDNFQRCAIANLPLRLDDDNDTEIRGIAALKPIQKGDNIIRIPYELAENLGEEGTDPTIPAVSFLKNYCETLLASASAAEANKLFGKVSYYQMLPPFAGEDCMSSTDFFPDHALMELQSPLIVEEIKKRKSQISDRFLSDISHNDSFPKWIDGSPVIEEHLIWAVWIITSRVLTVQGEIDTGRSYRLLIPFLDMCNHDRSSPHILTGRAVSNGELKVVAGAPLKKGDAINICYGGGVAGNDRFIQDYGFSDSNEVAFNIVAQQLLGKRRIVDGVGSGYVLSESDRLRSLKELDRTTVERDRDLLGTETDKNLLAAYNYRIGIKMAISKYS